MIDWSYFSILVRSLQRYDPFTDKKCSILECLITIQGYDFPLRCMRMLILTFVL